MTILTLTTDVTGQTAFGQFWGDKSAKKVELCFYAVIK